MSFVTWNMQGASHSTENKWNAGVLNLLRDNDLCCLQECGGIPPSAIIHTPAYGGVFGLDLFTWGTDRSHRYILFYPADPNGNRCNLAIVSNAAPTNGYLVIPAAAPIWRPSIGMTVGGVSYFTLHAISGGGPDAPGLVASAFGLGLGPTVAAGDFNRAPGTMGGAGVVCPPNGPTHPSTHPVSYLDYCIKNGGAASEGTVLAMHLSDHLAVQFA